MVASKREWVARSALTDLTTTYLIERLKDDAAHLAAGRIPRNEDDARAIGSELLELLTRLEGSDVVAA